MPAIPPTTLRRLAAITATVAALTSLVACGDKDAEAPAVTGTTAAPATSAAPSTPAAPSADAGSKLNVYIGCFNDTQESAHKAWERYTSWVKDIDAGPTGKERVVYGTYTVSDRALTKCGQPMLDTAAAKPPLPELDTAAKAYSETLTAWGKVLVEADKYYAREDYKDDAMAQGKALHPELVSRYKAYHEASTALSSQLDAENDKRQLAQLATLEKEEGRKFNYWHMSSMLTAKQLVTLIEADTFDTDAAATKLKAYEEASAGLIAFAKEPNANLPRMFSTMPSIYEKLLVAAKQRVRRVRDNTPYSTGEKMNLSTPGSGWMVNGSSDRVIHEYNNLVTSSNRLN